MTETPMDDVELSEMEDMAEMADDQLIAEPEAPNGFLAFDLSAPLMRAIVELGYRTPTPIQEATISLLLSGRDVIGQAQTGTGKTAAYGIPILERIDTSIRKPQALVLAPTRELAIQVAKALDAMARFRHLGVVPVYGGQSYERQLQAFRSGAHVVVGTPGRMLDHLRRGTLDLSAVRFAVLDEADEMLDMGFIDDVEAILSCMPGAPAARNQAPIVKLPEGLPPVQIALFSATMPAPIVRLSTRFMRNPEHISVTPSQAMVPQITQVAYDLGGMEKGEALGRILDVEAPGPTIVFCATRRAVDDIAERLHGRGYRTAGLHGDMAQAERERVMRRFRDGAVEVMVATDVAARGLDVAGVTHVINFDLPWDPEVYVHRIGRTGRAGREGEAITLVTPRDGRAMRQIEMALRAKIIRKRPPTLGDVAIKRRAAAQVTVATAIAAGNLGPYEGLVAELSEQFDASAIAAAALRLWDTARTAGRDGSTLGSILVSAAVEAERLEAQAREAPARAARAAEGGRSVARIFIGAGRAAGVRPQDLVGAIASEANVPGRSIGSISIQEHHSVVDVPGELAGVILSALESTMIRGRSVAVRLAEPADMAGDMNQGGGRDSGGYRGSDRGPRPGGSGGYRGGDQGGFASDARRAPWAGRSEPLPRHAVRAPSWSEVEAHPSESSSEPSTARTGRRPFAPPRLARRPAPRPARRRDA